MSLSSNGLVLAHWSSLVENMEASSQEFYKAVEQAVQKRQIPEIKITRVSWHESGILSAKREYLRVTRGKFLFDICAAPFGTGFFFSSWTVEKIPSPLWGIVGLMVVFFIEIIFYLFLIEKMGSNEGLGMWLLCLVISFAILAAQLSKGESYFADHVFVIPFIGPILERVFRPTTYYRYDTAAMFRMMVHNAVLETIDATTNAKGARQLSADERKPVMRDFFAR